MQDPSLKIASIHQPNESIIQLLEEALKAAKRGDVQAIATVTLNCDGSWSEAYGGLERCPVNSLVGAIESLKISLIINNTEL